MAEYESSSGPLAVGVAGSAPRRSEDLEAGISGGGDARCSPRSPPARRWGSYVALGSITPRSAGGGGGARFFFDPALEDEPRHFLDACFLCKKPLGRNRDIYMYRRMDPTGSDRRKYIIAWDDMNHCRGDTPFCSEECRQEQIEMDEAREKSLSLSMKASASRKEQPKQKDKAPQGMQVRAAVAV